VRRITERPSNKPVLLSTAPARSIRGGPLVSGRFFLGIVSSMTSSLRYWLSAAPRAPALPSLYWWSAAPPPPVPLPL
jgi:hypothetical protein